MAGTIKGSTSVARASVTKTGANQIAKRIVKTYTPTSVSRISKALSPTNVNRIAKRIQKTPPTPIAAPRNYFHQKPGNK